MDHRRHDGRPVGVQLHGVAGRRLAYEFACRGHRLLRLCLRCRPTLCPRLRFALGNWKIEVLSGFASAVFLLEVAALMFVGSVEWIVLPQPIYYQEAMVAAAVGMFVNIVCAMILDDAHEHNDHHGDHTHDDRRLQRGFECSLDK